MEQQLLDYLLDYNQPKELQIKQESSLEYYTKVDQEVEQLLDCDFKLHTHPMVLKQNLFFIRRDSFQEYLPMVKLEVVQLQDCLLDYILPKNH